MGRTMRGASLSRYDEAAAQFGLDYRAMLRSLDIDSRVLTDPDLRLPAESVVALMDRSAAATNCETFGLRLAALRQLSDYGPVSLLLAHQRTMRDAIMALIRYQQMLNESLVLEIDDFPGDVVVVREALLAKGDPRQAYELAIGTLFRIFSGPVGPRLRAVGVHFAHSPPSDPTFHRDFFGPIVEFNCEFNGFSIRREDFDRPNAAADPALAAHAERLLRAIPYAEASALAEEVQKAIHALLPSDGASIVTVAGRLGLSPRTLQRRLAEDDEDFTRLLNMVRREQAVQYLRGGRALAEVAELVGYSRETSFSRWFTGEFGVPPSEWRLMSPNAGSA